MSGQPIVEMCGSCTSHPGERDAAVPAPGRKRHQGIEAILSSNEFSSFMKFNSLDTVHPFWRPTCQITRSMPSIFSKEWTTMYLQERREF